MAWVSPPDERMVRGVRDPRPPQVYEDGLGHTGHKPLSGEVRDIVAVVRAFDDRDGSKDCRRPVADGLTYPRSVRQLTHTPVGTDSLLHSAPRTGARPGVEIYQPVRPENEHDVYTEIACVHTAKAQHVVNTGLVVSEADVDGLRQQILLHFHRQYIQGTVQKPLPHMRSHAATRDPREGATDELGHSRVADHDIHDGTDNQSLFDHPPPEFLDVQVGEIGVVRVRA